MMKVALVTFAIAAAGGGVLATHVLRDRLAPWFLSVVHALLGATGLVLVGLVVLQDPEQISAKAGLVILVAAALGGFYLAYEHLGERIPPKAIVLTHAAVAVVGFLTLLWAVLGG